MDLEDYISPERLKIYVDILKLKPDEVMWAYNWNKALCSAMQPRDSFLLQGSMNLATSFCLFMEPQGFNQSYLQLA